VLIFLSFILSVSSFPLSVFIWCYHIVVGWIDNISGKSAVTNPPLSAYK